MNDMTAIVLPEGPHMGEAGQRFAGAVAELFMQGGREIKLELLDETESLRFYVEEVSE